MLTSLNFVTKVLYSIALTLQNKIRLTVFVLRLTIIRRRVRVVEIGWATAFFPDQKEKDGNKPQFGGRQ